MEYTKNLNETERLEFLRKVKEKMEKINCEKFEINRLERKNEKYSKRNRAIDDYCDHRQPLIDEKYHQRELEIKIKLAAKKAAQLTLGPELYMKTKLVDLSLTDSQQKMPLAQKQDKNTNIHDSNDSTPIRDGQSLKKRSIKSSQHYSPEQNTKKAKKSMKLHSFTSPNKPPESTITSVAIAKEPIIIDESVLDEF